MIKIGVLTVSDRASKGEYEDLGGPAIVDYLNEVVISEWEPITVIVPDVQDTIAAAIKDFATQECAMVITTGGTGPAPRDVTPEATEAACDKLLPGFGEQMRTASLQYVPTAILSRQIAGLCGTTFVINLPGKPKAIAQCLDAVFAAIPACIEMAGGPHLETNTTRFTAFHPVHKH